MNRVQKAKQIVESVLRKLNNTEVEIGDCCYGSNKMRTTSQVVNCRSESDGINVELYNDTLKIGGEDDDDSNDGTLESNLQQNFVKILKERNEDIEVFDWICSEKGYWGPIVRFKSDKPVYKKIDKLMKTRDELYKKVSEFNLEFVKKLQTQKSKTKTCKGCKSSLVAQRLTSHNCPVCSNPLYSETDKKRVDVYKTKIATIDADIKAMLAS